MAKRWFNFIIHVFKEIPRIVQTVKFKLGVKEHSVGICLVHVVNHSSNF
jgi:hypothetical protein